jgi:hypothetical protein
MQFQQATSLTLLESKRSAWCTDITDETQARLSGDSFPQPKLDESRVHVPL